MKAIPQLRVFSGSMKRPTSWRMNAMSFACAPTTVKTHLKKFTSIASSRPRKNVRRLFLEYLRKINELHDKPAFYNTLLDNCTTAIWFNTRVNPGHLPFSWKILLSGYVPEYIYESHGMATRLPFEELQKQAHINPVAQAAGQSPDFSRRIRAGLENSQLQ
jgi:hypothetical protein